ncbi:MAG: histidine kinase [Ideonella sp.]
MNLWQRLDPRLHLAAAIGWSVCIVVTVAALIAASLAASEAESRVRSDSERLLTQFANQIRDALSMSLETRRSVVQATAAQIIASSDRGNQALRRHLDAVRDQFPEFAWLGVADQLGHVTAATDGMLEGADVSARPWFQRGRSGRFLSGVQQAPLLAAVLPPVADADASRFITLAVPLTHAAGRNVGVLGAQLAWRWVEHLQTELLRSLDTQRGLSLLLTADDGTVLVGPAAWLGRGVPGSGDLSEGGAYLVGHPAQHRQADGGPGWALVIRQDAVTALEPARATWRVVFLSVLLAGLAAAAAGVWATRALTRRLSMLASQALVVRSGAAQAIAVPTGKDEVSRIGATLAELVGHLQQEKQALRTLNAELDARVVERTARIERLAEDARHAAVTRERLRLARDLHDTLAHSLMALLTQIRMVRKLRNRWADGELEAELERIEEVAVSGLSDARGAITQMRHNGVRESGLGPALQDLLVRFRERTGLDATLQAEPAAAELANQHAEAVFRIAEEALRNVERHAKARSLRLQLYAVSNVNGPRGDAVVAQRLRLEIADDGVGFDPAVQRPGHYGLRGIEEQAELIGGRFELLSQTGRGTRVAVEFDA